MPVRRLKSGDRIVGTMVRLIRNPAIARMAREGGLDFIMLDLEHGPYGMETVSDIFSVGRAVGLGCFVRVPELARSLVSRVLDCGADGVMVPMLESVEQARKLVAWSKYAPLGDRGLGGIGGHTDYTAIAGSPVPFMKEANERVLAIAQIETVRAIEEVDGIAAVEGIDALLVGPNDLAISLGRPGELECRDMEKAIGKVAEAARKHGKVFGMHGPDALMERWIPQGMRLIMSGLDANWVASGMKAVVAKYKESGHGK